MKHFVLGYPDPQRKGAVTVLYAGDSRREARDALFAGGPGLAVADYVCNPQVSQSRRFRGVQKAKPQKAKPEKPAAKPKAEKPAPPPAAEKLPLPPKSRIASENQTD